MTKTGNKLQKPVSKVERPNPEPYIQQVHKGCGGIIVAVAKPRDLALACTKRKAVWEIEVPFMGKTPSQIPEDWENGKTE